MDKGISDGTRSKTTATITTEYQEIPARLIKFDKDKNGGKIQLGDGGFGVVYKGRYGGENGAAVVAIKRIKKSEYGIKPRDIDELKREAKMMYRVRHPDIVTVYGLVCDRSQEDDQIFAIVLEYMEWGSMEEFMEKFKVPWSIKVKMLEEVSRGLLFLCTPQPNRNYQIVHGDLKAANILIDRSFKAKLADFGTCRLQIITSKSTKRPFQATPTHTAPELFDIPMYENGECNPSPTEKSDVWSFGITIFETCAEIRPGKDYGMRDRVPFAAGVQDYQIIGMIRRSMNISQLFNPLQKKKIPEDCPKYLWDLILKCCAVEADDRLEFGEIHNFLEENFLKECESNYHSAMAELHNVIQTVQYGPTTKQRHKLEEYKKNQQTREREVHQTQNRESANQKEIIALTKPKVQFLCIHDFVRSVKEYEVDVAIDMHNNVTLIGTRGNIKNAKLHMFEMLQQMHIEKTELPEIMCQLLKIMDIEQAFPSYDTLTRKKIFWEVNRDDQITIYGKSKEDVIYCLDTLKDDIAVKTKEVPLERRNCFKTERWEHVNQQISHQFHERVKLVVETDFSAIHVCAIHNTVDTVMEMVDSLFKSQEPSTKILNLEKPFVEFLTNDRQNYISEILEQNSIYSVEIHPILDEDNAGFKVTGIGDGVTNAITALQELSEKIICTKHDVYNYPGMQKYFSSQGGFYMISGLENQYQVYIGVECYNITPKSSKSELKSELRVLTKFVTPRGGTIYIVQGDISSYCGGAIVCAATEELKIIGDLAKTIYEKGGEDIKQECIQQIKFDGTLLPGNVFPSKAGKMQCSHIIHAVVPEWKGVEKQEEFQKESSEAVHQALHQVDFFQHETVAFPIFASGSSKCLKEICCNVMASALKDFFETETTVSVKTVHLVDESLHNTSYFHAALQETFGTAGEQILDEKDTTTTCSYFTSQTNLNDSGISQDIAAKQSPSLKSNLHESFSESINALSVTFYIYGHNLENCNKTVEEIEKICKNGSDDKVLKSESDQYFIKKLSDSQIHRIKNMEADYQVKISVQRGKILNRIRIRGLHKDVSDVTDKIRHIFHEIQHIEKEALRNERNELISKMVEWKFDCGNHFQSFPCEQNALIEKEYASRKCYAEYTIQEEGKTKKTRINFDKMVKIELEKPNLEVQVKRYTLETVVDIGNRSKDQTVRDSPKTGKHVHFTEADGACAFPIGTNLVSEQTPTEYSDAQSRKILSSQFEAEKQVKRKLEKLTIDENAVRKVMEQVKAEERLKLVIEEEDRLYAMHLAAIEAGEEISLEFLDNEILQDNYIALGQNIKIEEHTTAKQKYYKILRNDYEGYLHFDGEDIAREIHLHRNEKPVLMLAGVDNEKMFQGKLSESTLFITNYLEISYKDFEIIWIENKGDRYFKKYKNLATSNALLKQHAKNEMKTEKISLERK